MDFFKATNGILWYISIDGGETFEWCPREPVLNDSVAAPLDDIPLNDAPSVPEEELSLNRDQLEQRGFTISKMTS